jgi:hypothetical protein
VGCATAACGLFGSRCQLGACAYSRAYAEHSSSSGWLLSDVVALGDAGGDAGGAAGGGGGGGGGLNGTAVFGCETSRRTASSAWAGARRAC